MIAFQKTLISSHDQTAAKATRHDYELILLTILQTILDRFERNREYPFVDTKLSVFTGGDFAEEADIGLDFKGRNAIYMWIQGRGIESLAGHARWLPSCSLLTALEKSQLHKRILHMTDVVLTGLEDIRRHNGGHLWFLMTPDGKPFTMGSDGRRQIISINESPYTISDVFCSKGFLAAAALLNHRDSIDEARRYFRAVLQAIADDATISDQVCFDPKNRPIRLPGKFFHGPRMLALGGLATWARILPADAEEAFACGERFVRQVVERHINHGQHQGTQRYDMCEAVDAQGQPWIENGMVIADPGHGCEFIGLAAKFLLVLQASGKATASQLELLRECRQLFPKVLAQNFRNGYNPHGGICKTYDLLARRPINSDMPWWNLPETIRAAAELAVLCPGHKSPELWEMLAMCSNAFLNNFVNPAMHLMSHQTLDENAKPIDVIPASADADPGYHTGLSIIDFLECLGA